jgi:hypothetical protein
MNGNYLYKLRRVTREFWTRLIMNYLFKFLLLSNLVIRTGNWYCPADFLPARVLNSSYQGLESCWIDVLYLTWFIDKGFAVILAWTWTRTFKVIVYQSHTYQLVWAVWVFHWVIPSQVLNTVGIMHRVCRAFEAFDDPDQDLAQFIKLRGFPLCDQF